MTYYSRRQLEALGEPLGDSVTRKEGGRIIYGGGGSGGGGQQQPTSTTAYQTNVPEYAKPYVTTMLGATQRQLFEGTPAGDGGFNITGFKPYQPYSSNVNDYFAGFSPMQQQAQRATGQLRVPGEYGQATQMTGLAGLGSLGLAGQMAGAGQNFARQAQDPMAMQGYMSPFMQNVVDFQKTQALRDFQIGQPMRRAQAVGAGAFGGSRQAIQEAEAERGLMSQLQGIQAAGTQKAFEDAQRQQQFGAQLGLQGQQAGLQGLGQFGQMAGQLGQLGGQQLTAQRDIIGLQNQMGAQQQALEQNKINQAIQDYATQQQYPLMQLGFMSNMLRGLPMQATTTQSYQATPSTLNQGIGLLAGAAGARQAGLFAEGGTIKGLASGGVTNYANRGMVQSNPDSSVVRGIRSKLEMMPAEQLQRVAQTSPSEEIRSMALQILREQQIREQAEAQAQQSIAQDQQRGLPTPVTERAGLPAAPAGSMDMLSAASGGIVAFAGPDGSQVDLDEEEAARLQQEFLARQQYADFYKKQREAAGVGAPKAALGEFYTKEQAALKDEEEKIKGYNLMDIGLNLATQTGSLPYAAAKAGKATLPGVLARQEGLRGRRGDIAKGLAEVAEGERLMKLGDITGGNKMFEQAQDRFSKEKIAGLRAPGNMTSYANNYLAERVAAGDTRDQATIRREGMDQYMYLYGQAGPRAATAAVTAQTGLFDKARDNVDSSLAKNYNSPENKKLRALQKDDKKNNTNTASAYQQELYRKEEQRLKGAAPGGGGGGGGGGSKAKVNPADFDS